MAIGTITSPVQAPAAAPRRARRRPVRRRPLRWALLGLIILGIGLGTGLQGSGWSWLTPFHDQTTEHSSTPLLVQLQNVAQFRAATGTFEVLVDVEHDTSGVPSVISGERTTLFATGTVDASVDFSTLGADQIGVSPDRRSATLTLPAPRLGAAVVDPARSRVVGRDRGLLQRLGSLVDDTPADDHELYALAGQKLDTAAQQSDLTARAEQNTRSMLTGLVSSLGFSQVTVTFDAPDQR